MELEEHLQRGFELSRQGQDEGAIAEFRRCVEIDPKDARPHLQLGRILSAKARREGQVPTEGVAQLKEAVRLDPDNGAYVDSLGWGLYRLGRHEEAAETLEWAARLEPDDATVLEHLGDALAATGRVEDAADAYRRALESSGGGSPSEAARKLERLRTER